MSTAYTGTMASHPIATNSASSSTVFTGILYISRSVACKIIAPTSIEWSHNDHRRSVDEWARQIVSLLLEGVAQLLHIDVLDVQSPPAARL
ncbi:MAG: hypothetical protein ACXWP6_04980 [Ktedonobacterales bacterium]